jgi:hypothetical protein
MFITTAAVVVVLAMEQTPTPLAHQLVLPQIVVLDQVQALAAPMALAALASASWSGCHELRSC